jgi:phosphoribosylformylglycinamidine synthase subunit PurSL
MLWQIDIYPKPGEPNRAGADVAAQSHDLGLADGIQCIAAHGFLVEGDLSRDQIDRIARDLLVDSVVEVPRIGATRDDLLSQPPEGDGKQNDYRLVHVLPKPGVMDPVAQSAETAIRDLLSDGANSTNNGHASVRTFRKYWLANVPDEKFRGLALKLLANDAIEQVVFGPLTFDRLEVGSSYSFKLVTVPIRSLDEAALTRLSREGQLYLSLTEMQTIQAHFQKLDRDPTDAELETIAQTWSEHCSHKTLGGRIAYRDENGERRFESMLKETIFAATQQLRRDWGNDDWCVSVFKDNAGIVKFDDEFNVCFKVETHNHPSALEPYGGANTGLGGVIRDTLGTGLGAKPICNTDVFCFAPPDTPADTLPAGVLHPRRVIKGVVSGVRDYGNRMGIPTVNGAVYFDPRYLGNPLVYCGNVGLIPRDKSFKEVKAGDYIVAVGGRTGRDGIHGATFSSAELTTESETVSGGAVQIGNAITEKMVVDVVLQARDRGLFSAITDCGAGGFSSAVGEMGESLGAEVWLDRAPVKYDGLSYTEIWISEAQERMVLSVAPEKWDEFEALCRGEGVEATIIGKFVPTGRLKLKYHDQEVADLTMQFLHEGRPPVVREAVYEAPATRLFQWTPASTRDHSETLRQILGSLNVASKHWIIRQYDHEVLAGSVVKPLVGTANDGPSDAAVVKPVLGSDRGVVIACGMNPHYGDFDTYHMAASAIDEAIRNCVAVGADPNRIAILDNFCWGNTDRPETLGSLVRAALACHDLSVAFGTPFISGKDSLNNEFRVTDAEGGTRSIAIPPSLLISALGQVDDVRKCVTMDLKEPGNVLYMIGITGDEMGGSHAGLVRKLHGGNVPKVNAALAKETFVAVHKAISNDLVRACHDLSEGGLAAAIAEMCFAGGFGAALTLEKMPTALFGVQLTEREMDATLLFSESNSRFLCEVSPTNAVAFEAIFADKVPCRAIGKVTDGNRLNVRGQSGTMCIGADIDELKAVWKKPLDW